MKFFILNYIFAIILSFFIICSEIETLDTFMITLLTPKYLGSIVLFPFAKFIYSKIMNHESWMSSSWQSSGCVWGWIVDILLNIMIFNFAIPAGIITIILTYLLVRNENDNVSDMEFKSQDRSDDIIW